jgi:hypothetical protein
VREREGERAREGEITLVLLLSRKEKARRQFAWAHQRPRGERAVKQEQKCARRRVQEGGHRECRECREAVRVAGIELQPQTLYIIFHRRN